MEIKLKNNYPLDTKEQLEKAASYFDKYLERFTPYERVKIAHGIDMAASKHKVNLDMDWVTNYGRMFKSAAISPDFKKSIEMRKVACRRHDVGVQIMDKAIDSGKVLDGISKLAEKKASSKTLVSALEAFDKQAGIEYLYDKEILDPVMSVHGSLNNPEFDSVKVAKDATQYDLIRASRDTEKVASIKEAIGEEFSESFKKNPIMSLKKLGSIETNLLGRIVKG